MFSLDNVHKMNVSAQLKMNKKKKQNTIHWRYWQAVVSSIHIIMQYASANTIFVKSVKEKIIAKIIFSLQFEFHSCHVLFHPVFGNGISNSPFLIHSEAGKIRILNLQKKKKKKNGKNVENGKFGAQQNVRFSSFCKSN